MKDNLKIEEYRSLLEKMESICNEMPGVILPNYFNRNKYLYSLYFEAFNSIKGVCVLLGNGGLIPQASAVLRMAIEQTATIRLLEDHKELFEKYVEHRKFRFTIRDEWNNKKEKKIREHFKNEMDEKDNERPLEYLDYGWFKSINEKYSFNRLIELSKIQEQDNAIQKWKTQLNNFIHGNLESINLISSVDAPLEYAHQLIQIVAKLLDILIVEFHNENKFNFIIDNVDYREAFLEAYRNIF